MGDKVGPSLSFFQHLGLMEVAHASLGVVRGSPLMTLLPIFSRVVVVAVLNECPATFKNDATFVPMMLVAWCTADSLRYVYYAFGQARDIATSTKGVAVAMKLIKAKSVERADDPVFKIPFPLVWLRYSMFIILYPMGVFGEMSCLWLALSELMRYTGVAQAKSISMWTLQNLKLLFNALGATSERSVYGLICLSYLFGLPPLYLMLLASRKKQLAPAPRSDSKKKKTQ